jgi:hypothetical protein
MERTVLRPATALYREKLFETERIKSVVPLDCHLGLNLLPFKITVAAMAEIAYWVQKSNSYDDAEEALRRNTKIDVKNDTMRFVANTVGKIVLDNDLARAEESYRLLNSGGLTFPKKKLDRELYVECDGAMFRSREKGDEEDGGDKGDRGWKEIKSGVVYGSDTFIGRTDDKGEPGQGLGNREYAAYAGSADVFRKLLFDLALRNGYGKYKTTILLTNGASWIKNTKDLLFPDAVLILDFFHLREKVRDFSNEYFDHNEAESKPWRDNTCKMLRNGEINAVLNILRGLKKFETDARAVNLRDYITENIDGMDYKHYEDNGWHVGGGDLESANKTVLRERLKQAGTRWNAETAGYVTALVTKAKSRLWDRDVVRALRRHYGVARPNDDI